jgi:hypothetical protein
MASHALQRWETDQRAELDRVAAVHQAVGGTSRGRRWRIQHVNDSYILLLAAHFQLFSRNLHTEAVTFFVSQVAVSVLARTQVQLLLMRDRQLDQRNAQPGSLGADFARLGMDLWPALRDQNPLNEGRKHKLEQLNIWRNAIAHQKLPLSSDQLQKAGGTSRTLRYIQRWRSSCNSLAIEMDLAVAGHLQTMVGQAPW